MWSLLSTVFAVPKLQGTQAAARGTIALHKYLKERKTVFILVGTWLSLRLRPHALLLLG